MEATDCVVCFESTTVTKLNCNHFICKECFWKIQLSEVISHSCPLCRTPFMVARLEEFFATDKYVDDIYKCKSDIEEFVTRLALVGVEYKISFECSAALMYFYDYLYERCTDEILQIIISGDKTKLFNFNMIYFMSDKRLIEYKYLLDNNMDPKFTTIERIRGFFMI